MTDSKLVTEYQKQKLNTEKQETNFVKLYRELESHLSDDDRKLLSTLKDSHRKFCETRQRYYDLDDYFDLESVCGYLHYFKELVNES